MPDYRAFCRPADPEAVQLILDAEESHHLISVNRARAGETVTLFDGRGAEWVCTLEAPDRRAAKLHVRQRSQGRPRAFRVSLGQALPKGPAMDAIMRKATELGAARIIPLESERTQVHLEDQRGDRKVEKWRMASIEAAKQCGNPWLPEIEPVQTAMRFMEQARGYDLKLIASLQPGARSLKTALADFRAERGGGPQEALWLVGPEGDFTPEELSAAQSAGFVPVTLGPLVLRCETAAIYALGVLSYELQNP